MWVLEDEWSWHVNTAVELGLGLAHAGKGWTSGLSSCVNKDTTMQGHSE